MVTVETRRERGKRERRGRLIDAAMRLFSERGFDAVTVEEIARAADVGKGTFFNYFPTKFHVLVDYRQSLYAHILRHADRIEGDTARALFRNWFHHAAQVFEKEGPLFDVLWRQVLFNPELHRDRVSQNPDIMPVYRRFLDVGIDAGELRSDIDHTLVVDVIGNIWMGCLVDWVMGDRSFSLHEPMWQRLDLLFDGLTT